MKNKTKKNRISVRTVCWCLAVLVFAASTWVSPSSASSYSQQIDEAKDELTDIQGELDSAQEALEAGKARSKELSKKISTLENQIYTTGADVEKLKADINETKLSISDKLEELERAQKDVDDQNSALNNRLRAMYKNGDVGMLSVLFGSTTISDLLTNIEMVKRIYDSDAELLESIETRYGIIDDEKEALLSLKNQLITQEKELEEKQVQLAADKESVEALKSQVDRDNNVLSAEIDAMNEEAKAITAKILELQSKEAYIGGELCWPSQSSKRITSPFGMRIHPTLKVNKMHTGIDIGASMGTNILAANSGKVITAGWNSSYGYMIMIDHGGGIVTLYAHSSALLVSKGDIVNRGQVIALVGSTGRSTGPHLHFEVRVNGEYKNPMDYFN